MHIINTQSKDPESYSYLEEIRFEPDLHLTMRVFGLVIAYLKNSLLVETSLKFWNYTRIMQMPSISTIGVPIIDQKFMVLDAQAIEHLDILIDDSVQVIIDRDRNQPFTKMSLAEKN